MFTHLHAHTEYSLLDGLSRISSLVQRARALGMDSLALTDHGGLYGAIEFYNECRAQGIKPIIGCELYVAQGSRHGRSFKEDGRSYHLTVLAKNNTGYHNLIHLVDRAHLEGFYYKPRVDRELLWNYREGLVVLSGCPGAEIPQLLLSGDLDAARQAAGWYRETFQDFYLELQWHENLPELIPLNQGLLSLADEMGIPLVLTNDVHYVEASDAETHDVLLCIQTKTTVQEQNRLKLSDGSYYLKSAEEMSGLFPDLQQAMENTRHIAEMCNLELDFSTLHLPHFEPPVGETPQDYLERICREGLRQRVTIVTDEAEERLASELDVIRATQFAHYFLVVWDIATFARKKGILFGVRGSAAASLVLYSLSVTDIDPLEYNLVFERFLNVERKEMPDIDMDFQDDRRDEVLSYLVDRYGQDHVAQIITFGTLGPKAAIRDVGRALGLSYSDVDRVARLIPMRVHSLDEAMSSIEELRDLYDGDEALRNVIDTAKRLEGVTRHASTHAAGVVISQNPLTEYVPLQNPRKGNDRGIAMTQYAMAAIAQLGLLKMDILGLINLTVLSQARDLVAGRTGEPTELQDLPLDDAKTFELLASGETTGVFQLEGEGMRGYIRDLRPSTLAEVAAMIALYRPGPMEHIQTFIDAKHERSPIRYPHPDLEPILQETYGVIVYQDQVLRILQQFSGYSLGEADIVRKAMGKKIPELMRHERTNFLQGAQAKGYSSDLTEQIFNLIEPFAGYAFNKAHSVSYAMVAYWTAYFKANHPLEYMVALLNAHLGNIEKVATIISECRRLKIRILPPDVTRSKVEFSKEKEDREDRSIRFGLAAVKNVGGSAVRLLVESCEKEGAFTSLEDFCSRCGWHGLEGGSQGLNRSTLESLIMVGALDFFGNRGVLLSNLDSLVNLAQLQSRLKQAQQMTFRDVTGDDDVSPVGNVVLIHEGLSTSEREREWERELLGVYLSGGPLDFAKNDQVFRARRDIQGAAHGVRVSVAGEVYAMRRRSTKTEWPFLVVTLALLDGMLDVLVWSTALVQNHDLWKEGSQVLVVGKVQFREEKISLRCEEARPHSPGQSYAVSQAQFSTEDEMPSRSRSSNGKIKLDGVGAEIETNRGQIVSIQLQETNFPQEDLELLRQVLRTLIEFPGDDLVHLLVLSKGRLVRLEMAALPADALFPLTIKFCGELQQRLEELIGPGSVAVAR